ncbi:phosphotransferase family protein [Streptomyces sp. NPDC048644]|uniref:phosphotransferase family protein n=1 Tax=Streptomyces sp. NPDC048644 TaxID=3365582 RepID=UPI00370F8DFB
MAAVADRTLATESTGDDTAERPPRRTFLLGGGLHGWCLDSTAVPPAAPGGQPTADDETELISAAVIASRLRTWAALAGPAPAFSTAHRPGSDSTGVVQFRTGGEDGKEIVAKIGDAAMIRSETGFIARTNREITAIGRDPLFPELHGVHIEGHQGVSLMEAGHPAELDAQLFQDDARTALRPDAADTLGPYLDQLGSWYRLTAADHTPTSGDYLYRERFHALREQPAFLSTFRAFFGDLDLDALLGAELLLPGGARIPGYTEAAAWLDTHAPGLLPRTGSQVHGDIFPTNMLRRAGGGPMFIDPRTVWEKRQRPDVGYGDPVFDLATLLHGLLPMTAILQASKQDRPQNLFGDLDLTRPHDLTSLRLPLHFSPELRAMESRLAAAAPGGEPVDAIRCRLYIGAACSLAGWLKYEHSLRSPHAWLATYAYTAWYLQQARSVHENHSS